MRHTRHHGASAPGLAAPERAVVHVGLAPPGSAGAASAGLSPPQKDETRELGSVAGFKGQIKADTLDCAHTTAERKRLNTLTARMALAGWALTADATGTFTAARWGMARDLHGLAAVEAFAAQVGAPS